MDDYKELIEMLRSMSRAIIREDANDMNIPEENIWDADANALADAADAIEQLIKERDAYAKAFRITSSDEPLINHAVVKIDYADIIAHSTDELVCAIAYRLARVIEDARSKGGRA